MGTTVRVLSGQQIRLPSGRVAIVGVGLAVVFLVIAIVAVVRRRRQRGPGDFDVPRGMRDPRDPDQGATGGGLV